MRKILHLVKKEFRQIRRDRPMMALLFLIPIVQLLFLGYAVSTDVGNVRVAVCDLDGSVLSRQLIDRFRNSGYLRVRFVDPREGKVGDYLDRGSASVVLVIPKGLSTDVSRGVPVRIQVLMDGQDSNTSTIALGYVQGILENFIQDQIAAGGVGSMDPAGFRFLVPDIRIWYNEDLKTSHYMIPGIVVFLLTMVTSLLSAMGLVREKEIGTLEQLLVSPLKKHAILIGKIIPYSVVGFI